MTHTFIPQCFHSTKHTQPQIDALQNITKSLTTAFVWLAARCWVSWCSNLEWVHVTELVDALADSWATSWWWSDIEVLPQTTVSQQVGNWLWQNHWCRLLQWLVIISIVMGYDYQHVLTGVLISWLSLNTSPWPSILPVHHWLSPMTTLCLVTFVLHFY